MKRGLRNIIIDTVEKTHFRIFKYTISADMKIFLSNMSYAGISSVITAFMLGILQIVAVRVLGPVEYGKVSLVFTIANFVPYLMFMGIHSGLSKYLPEKTHQSNKVK
jgi:O-antigen/teichoic acid export membrane protein